MLDLLRGDFNVQKNKLDDVEFLAQKMNKRSMMIEELNKKVIDLDHERKTLESKVY